MNVTVYERTALQSIQVQAAAVHYIDSSLIIMSTVSKWNRAEKQESVYFLIMIKTSLALIPFLHETVPTTSCI